MIYQNHEIKKAGYEILEAKGLAHPEDAHLLHVLAKRDSDGEYVVWMYNKNDRGFFQGAYYPRSMFIEAYTAYDRRQ